MCSTQFFPIGLCAWYAMRGTELAYCVGLNRDFFVPFIHLLKKQCIVYNLQQVQPRLPAFLYQYAKRGTETAHATSCSVLAYASSMRSAVLKQRMTERVRGVVLRKRMVLALCAECSMS